MMGTFLSFYFYFFLKAKIQTSAFAEFTESFLQYLIKAELGLLEARLEYENTLKKIDKFDVVLLSMGEDGHIASLFPNHVYPEEQMVIVEQGSPKPPKERISMSYQQLNKAHYVFKLIIGESKQKAVTVLGQNVNLPIARVNGECEKLFFCKNAINN